MLQMTATTNRRIHIIGVDWRRITTYAAICPTLTFVHDDDDVIHGRLIRLSIVDGCRRFPPPTVVVVFFGGS